MNYQFKILENENWWGGTAAGGPDQPYTAKSNAKYDFRRHCSNQTMPLLVSSEGRYIWSENPFALNIHDGIIEMEGEEIILVEAGSTLKDAYLAASKAHFPFEGKDLPEEFFATAQYNTWMEFTYFPTQEKVLDYAHKIIENGFKPGILIIDEGWHGRYGIWEFDELTFPDPKAMMDELHALGFKVMLWVTPMITPDGLNYVRNVSRNPCFAGPEYKSKFLRTDDGKVALVEWWNGYSAIHDFFNPNDVEYLDSKLQKLMRDYGVDGFKFDGASVGMYHSANIVNGVHTAHTPHEHNIEWNKFGARYKFHEYKDTYKGGGRCVIQRIRDRNHTWDGDGLASVLPFALTQGLIGHPFICPDMIGGGEWTYRWNGTEVDQELFVRMAQASALFPMMQFSWAPWAALDEEHLGYVKEAAELHCKFADKIIDLVHKSTTSGEPILRAMEYNYPHAGYADVHDMFMLGDDTLVCPVLVKGQTEREIRLPEGKWQTEDGKIWEGTHTFATPVSKLLYFTKA